MDDAYQHTTGWTIASAILPILTAAALALHGHGGRVFADPPVCRSVDSPDQAFLAWKAEGVRGRILILFGRYPHFTTTYESYLNGAPLSSTNFVHFAILDNIVRRIDFVVDDAEWPGFSERRELYQPFRDVPGVPGAVYLPSPSGIPLVAMPVSSLRSPGEPALVLIDEQFFNRERVSELLSRIGIVSDMEVVVRRPGS